MLSAARHALEQMRNSLGARVEQLGAFGDAAAAQRGLLAFVDRPQDIASARFDLPNSNARRVTQVRALAADVASGFTVQR